MLDEMDLSVGQVAKRCGVRVSSLHFYENKGLIKSLRNQGNQRRYHRDVIRRISVIKAAQKMGVSLQEIKHAFSYLPNERTPNKDDWAKLSESWNKQLTQRINYLTDLRDSLNACIGCGCLSMKSCPIYNPEDNLGIEGVGSVILDKAFNDD
ncbi:MULTISPECIES: redox-sensitive transcriptional activator SoxR [Shewanella]|uniref:redox-sensitive transcriptional activator SoxR n=1 Tax=Shewanella TaxID=22 RepID=UPI001BBB9C41|nr:MULTISPECIES: redox-sensitive transcriptional activator SoxR [Shewanella]GIU52656.1 redox-sensitive transcriptional activator SoxR [Shewanella sp. KT0246]